MIEKGGRLWAAVFCAGTLAAGLGAANLVVSARGQSTLELRVSTLEAHVSAVERDRESLMAEREALKRKAAACEEVMDRAMEIIDPVGYKQFLQKLRAQKG